MQKICLENKYPVPNNHYMQKFLDYNQIVRKPVVLHIGRILSVLIAETQYAQSQPRVLHRGPNQFPPPEEDMSSTQEELSSSEQEADPEVSFHPNHPQVK